MPAPEGKQESGAGIVPLLLYGGAKLLQFGLLCKESLALQLYVCQFRDGSKLLHLLADIPVIGFPLLLLEDAPRSIVAHRLGGYSQHRSRLRAGNPNLVICCLYV